jgi:hypothetical protein
MKVWFKIFIDTNILNSAFNLLWYLAKNFGISIDNCIMNFDQ